MMRGIGMHKPPVGTQEWPEDNTSKYVNDQVHQFLMTGVYIHPEIAREIAAWYQAPSVLGLPFTKFASTGTIDEDFVYSIRSVLMKAAREDRDVLYALYAYVVNAR
jgi:hypothetical protein